MADEPLREARFDHVNEHGDLVFEALNRHFTVRVTDSLERGIMEAKQVRAELEGTPQPQAASALPISQIQSMIRAGITPVRIAAQFGVAEPLVRRFAAPVETEKKYAIDQFLSMSANKAVRGSKSNADVIAESLQTSRIDMDSLIWQATRRGHEPWRIQATFESANRTLKADWSWNMRDNSVVSLNSIAKRLLGETAAPVPGLANEPAGRDGARFNWGDSGAAAATTGLAYDAPAGVVGLGDASAAEVHSDAAPGAMNPVTAWMYGGVGKANSAQAAGTGTTTTNVSNSETSTVRTSDITVSEGTIPPAAGMANPIPNAEQTPAVTVTDSGRITPVAQQPAGSGEGSTQDATAAMQPAAQATSTQPATAQPATVKPAEPETKPKRRSSRSAVPSWDEILFGE